MLQFQFYIYSIVNAYNIILYKNGNLFLVSYGIVIVYKLLKYRQK
jgi:hypothetical protein